MLIGLWIVGGLIGLVQSRFLVMRAEGRKYGIFPAEIAADLDMRMGGES